MSTSRSDASPSRLLGSYDTVRRKAPFLKRIFQPASSLFNVPAFVLRLEQQAHVTTAS